MSASHVIYSRDYTHKGHQFSIWSYVDGGTMLFACRCDGLNLDGLGSREEAHTRAKAHLNGLAPPEEPPR